MDQRTYSCNILVELQKKNQELPEYSDDSHYGEYWWTRNYVGHYVIGDEIPGLNKQMVTDYIKYLGTQFCNIRLW